MESYGVVYKEAFPGCWWLGYDSCSKHYKGKIRTFYRNLCVFTIQKLENYLQVSSITFWIKTVMAYLKNRGILLIMVSMGAILYPLILVLNRGTHFNIDWYHNLWLIGYFGEYFFEHHTFPVSINTFRFTNINMPLFYGYLFYPSLGLMSSILGPNITLRLAIVSASSMQFFAIFVLMKKLTKNVWLGIAIACLSIWTIYPLTNLYNRSAILEFFAGVFLFTSLCIWFVSIICTDTHEKVALRVLFALSFSFVIGTHPITGFYGSIYVGVLILFSIVFSPKKQGFWVEFLSSVVVSVLVVLILSPWLYATLKFSDYLSISHYFDQKLLFFKGIDEIWVRLSPFPLDLRSIRSGIDMPAPYLDAQTNTPLLIYLIFQGILLIRFSQKSNFLIAIIKSEMHILALVLFSLFSFIYFLIVSLSPWAATSAQWLLWRAQFAYRFVTYQNVSIFIGTVAFFMLIRKIDVQIVFQPIMRYLLIGCLVLSAQSVLIKLTHAYSILGHFLNKQTEGDVFLKGYGIKREDKYYLINLPETFTSIGDYSTSSLGMDQNSAPSLPVITENIIVQSQNNFGKLGEVEIYASEPVMVGVNVVPFPWSYILVNGQLVERKDTFLIGDRIYFQLKPGNHKITAELKPDFPWKVLRIISLLAILICSFFLIFQCTQNKKYCVIYASDVATSADRADF